MESPGGSSTRSKPSRSSTHDALPHGKTKKQATSMSMPSVIPSSFGSGTFATGPYSPFAGDRPDTSSRLESDAGSVLGLDSSAGSRIGTDTRSTSKRLKELERQLDKEREERNLTQTQMWKVVKEIQQQMAAKSSSAAGSQSADPGAGDDNEADIMQLRCVLFGREKEPGLIAESRVVAEELRKLQAELAAMSGQMPSVSELSSQVEQNRLQLAVAEAALADLRAGQAGLQEHCDLLSEAPRADGKDVKSLLEQERRQREAAVSGLQERLDTFFGKQGDKGITEEDISLANTALVQVEAHSSSNAKDASQGMSDRTVLVRRPSRHSVSLTELEDRIGDLDKRLQAQVADASALGRRLGEVTEEHFAEAAWLRSRLEALGGGATAATEEAKALHEWQTAFTERIRRLEKRCGEDEARSTTPSGLKVLGEALRAAQEEDDVEERPTLPAGKSVARRGSAPPFNALLASPAGAREAHRDSDSALQAGLARAIDDLAALERRLVESECSSGEQIKALRTFQLNQNAAMKKAVLDEQASSFSEFKQATEERFDALQLQTERLDAIVERQQNEDPTQSVRDLLKDELESRAALQAELEERLNAAVRQMEDDRGATRGPAPETLLEVNSVAERLALAEEGHTRLSQRFEDLVARMPAAFVEDEEFERRLGELEARQERQHQELRSEHKDLLAQASRVAQANLEDQKRIVDEQLGNLEEGQGRRLQDLHSEVATLESQIKGAVRTAAAEGTARALQEIEALEQRILQAVERERRRQKQQEMEVYGDSSPCSPVNSEGGSKVLQTAAILQIEENWKSRERRLERIEEVHRGIVSERKEAEDFRESMERRIADVEEQQCKPHAAVLEELAALRAQLQELEATFEATARVQAELRTDQDRQNQEGQALAQADRMLTEEITALRSRLEEAEAKFNDVARTQEDHEEWRREQPKPSDITAIEDRVRALGVRVDQSDSKASLLDIVMLKQEETDKRLAQVDMLSQSHSESGDLSNRLDIVVEKQEESGRWLAQVDALLQKHESQDLVSRLDIVLQKQEDNDRRLVQLDSVLQRPEGGDLASRLDMVVSKLEECDRRLAQMDALLQKHEGQDLACRLDMVMQKQEDSDNKLAQVGAHLQRYEGQDLASRLDIVLQKQQETDKRVAHLDTLWQDGEVISRLDIVVQKQEEAEARFNDVARTQEEHEEWRREQDARGPKPSDIAAIEDRVRALGVRVDQSDWKVQQMEQRLQADTVRSRHDREAFERDRQEHTMRIEALQEMIGGEAGQRTAHIQVLEARMDTLLQHPGGGDLASRLDMVMLKQEETDKRLAQVDTLSQSHSEGGDLSSRLDIIVEKQEESGRWLAQVDALLQKHESQDLVSRLDIVSQKQEENDRKLVQLDSILQHPEGGDLASRLDMVVLKLEESDRRLVQMDALLQKHEGQELACRLDMVMQKQEDSDNKLAQVGAHLQRYEGQDLVSRLDIVLQKQEENDRRVAHLDTLWQDGDFNSRLDMVVQKQEESDKRLVQVDALLQRREGQDLASRLDMVAQKQEENDRKLAQVEKQEEIHRRLAQMNTLLQEQPDGGDLTGRLDAVVQKQQESDRILAQVGMSVQKHEDQDLVSRLDIMIQKQEESDRRLEQMDALLHHHEGGHMASPSDMGMVRKQKESDAKLTQVEPQQPREENSTRDDQAEEEDFERLRACAIGALRAGREATSSSYADKRSLGLSGYGTRAAGNADDGSVAAAVAASVGRAEQRFAAVLRSGKATAMPRATGSTSPAAPANGGREESSASLSRIARLAADIGAELRCEFGPRFTSLASEIRLEVDARVTSAEARVSAAEASMAVEFKKHVADLSGRLGRVEVGPPGPELKRQLMDVDFRVARIEAQAFDTPSPTNSRPGQSRRSESRESETVLDVSRFATLEAEVRSTKSLVNAILSQSQGELHLSEGGGSRGPTITALPGTSPGTTEQLHRAHQQNLLPLSRRRLSPSKHAGNLGSPPTEACPIVLPASPVVSVVTRAIH